MSGKIAMGFHSAVDYELTWDAGILQELARNYDIRNKELRTGFPVRSERDIVIVSLAHMAEGSGGEYMPATNEQCKEFASHFAYRRTIGGTATRAAIALSKLGYESTLSMCCCNHVIKELLPPEIHRFSNVGEGDTDIYPHVILSYPGHVQIKVNDIEFTAPRENRVMFSNDADALNMEVSKAFSSELTDTKVFLLGCFSEVMEKDILKDRMEKTAYLLDSLQPDAWAVFEDGCYINKELRYYVHSRLKARLDVLSMNEDEMQEFVGKKIDILDPEAVSEAVAFVYGQVGVPILIVHSSSWALAYGKTPEKMEMALRGGVCLSATRFRCGDEFGMQEYHETERLSDKREGEVFCDGIKEILGGKIYCIPTKDLSFVGHPTVVGLGDFFAGGLLPGLLTIKK